MQTGWQAHWLVQTNLGSMEWSGEDLTIAAGKGERPKLIQSKDFPGFDRQGILLELMQGVDGGPCQVPTVSDNIRSLLFVNAIERSLKEQGCVTVSELS